MTFRTITPESDGFFIPPTPAGNYATRALEAAAPDIQRRLDLAVALDAQHALLAAVAPLEF
jgi:hypothetical protein